MKRLGLFFFPFFALSCFAFFVWAGLGGFSFERPVRVETAIAALAPIPDFHPCLGIVEARFPSLLKSRCSGILTEVSVREGDSIFPGQLLARIRRPDCEEQRASLESELVTSREEAQAAEENLERLLVAYQQGQITLAQLNQLRLQEASAKARFRRSERALRQVNARIDEGNLVAATSAIVLRRFLEPEEKIGAAMPVFSLAEGGRFVVRLVLPFDTPLVVGQKAQIRLFSSPNEILPGLVGGIVSGSGAVAEGWISFGEGRCWEEGSLAKVEVQNGSHRGILVPPSAVFLLGSQPIVYKIDGNAARQVAVKIGARTPQAIELLEGLRAGQRFVSNCSQPLRDGKPVIFSP